MEEKFLIRMMTWENDSNYPTMIKAFYSNHISELLKLYLIAKDKEMLIDIPDEENEKSKFDGHESYITDIRINFGGKESIPTLDIYVKVI